MNKQCTKCLTNKDISEFNRDSKQKDELKYLCRKCESDYHKQRYPSKKEQINENRKRWAADNKERMREWRRNYVKIPIIRLRRNIGKRVRKLIKDPVLTSNRIGCSGEFLRQYLESKWLLGMNWNNYGFGNDKWHIDHIKPLSSFDLTDPEELKKASHYTNLQPLWQKDNLSKGNKIIDII